MAQRILVNTSAVLSRTFAPDGDPTNADGNVTYTGIDETGTTVFSGTASANGSGNYSFTVTPQTQLNRITVTWTGTWSGQTQTVTEYIEIVGAHLFTETQARAFHDSAMANTTTYPDARIAEHRDRITDQFERLCSVSFVPRYERDRLPGTGTRQLIATKRRITSIISATINGTTQTVGDLVTLPAHTDIIHHTTNTWTKGTDTNPLNVTVEYVHGWDTPPLEITRAALAVLRYQLVESNIGDRVVSLTDETGTMRLAQPGFRGVYYGIPWIDRVLEDFNETIPVF